MTVKLRRGLLFLALFNANLSSFAKGFRGSQRNVYPCLDEESSETGDGFQCEYIEKASEEERVLAAIARAEESGNDISACYSRTYRQSFDGTDSLSDDTACSDWVDQGIDKPLSTNPNQPQRELGITDAVEGKTKPSSPTATQISRISVPIGGPIEQQQPKTNQPASSGLHSEKWQSRPSQSASIRKGNHVQKQSTIPIQQVKGSVSDTAKSQKPSSTTTPWIRRYLSSRPRDGR
mmetsp:Transcript_2500/g.5926  ORF Transcript_2500/g.5926 Transcript_2500/m.5926 type:complete len:235 (+) Transcript_2500:81-785(+)